MVLFVCTSGAKTVNRWFTTYEFAGFFTRNIHYSQDYWKEKRIRDANNKNVYKLTWVNNKDADGYEVGYMKEINTCGESICHNYSHKSEVFTVITKYIPYLLHSLDNTINSSSNSG